MRPIANDAGQLVDDDPLVNGTVIALTDEVDDLEQLVVSGADLLAIITADKLAAAVQTGANAFGGRGSTIGNFLDSVGSAVGRYNEDTDDLLAFIDSLDNLTAALAPVAQENADYLVDMLAASQALQREDDRLLDTLDDVTRLSIVGARFLDDNATVLDNLIRRVRMILNEVTRVDGGLQRLFTWLPVHNANVPNGAINEKAQVWLDFVLCDYNDDKNDPSESCDPTNPGEGGERPPNAAQPSDSDTTPQEPISGDEPENQPQGDAP
ncbi:MAG: ABC-type transporter Mla subunit MlaD [Glaciecola sp.]